MQFEEAGEEAKLVDDLRKWEGIKSMDDAINKLLQKMLHKRAYAN